MLESTWKTEVVPLNLTAVAPVKLMPVITTLVPTIPEPGEKPLIRGAPVKVPALVALPTGVVTLILPVVSAGGTVAVNLIAELIV